MIARIARYPTSFCFVLAFRARPSAKAMVNFVCFFAFGRGGGETKPSVLHQPGDKEKARTGTALHFCLTIETTTIFNISSSRLLLHLILVSSYSFSFFRCAPAALLSSVFLTLAANRHHPAVIRYCCSRYRISKLWCTSHGGVLAVLASLGNTTYATHEQCLVLQHASSQFLLSFRIERMGRPFLISSLWPNQ